MGRIRSWTGLAGVALVLAAAGCAYDPHPEGGTLPDPGHPPEDTFQGSALPEGSSKSPPQVSGDMEASYTVPTR